MRRILIVIFCLLLLTVTAFAQPTKGGLSVIREQDRNLIPLISEIKQNNYDTGTVKTLLKICHIYWHEGPNKNVAQDSTFYYAQKAYVLSGALQFMDGINESLFLMCKVYLARRDFSNALRLLGKTYGEQRVLLTLLIAETYVFRYQSTDKEFRLALPLITEVRQLSKDSIHSLAWENESLLLLGKYYFKQGDLSDGKRTIMEIIDTLHQLKDYSQEGNYWSALANNFPQTAATVSEIRHSNEMAVHCYKLAGEEVKAAYCLRDLALINSNNNEVVLAEQQYMEMLRIFTEHHEKISLMSYVSIADFYRFTGDFDKALLYAFKALKTPETNSAKSILPYQVLGDTYALLNDFSKSIANYQKVFDFEVSADISHKYVVANQLANVTAADGNPSKALKFLTDFIENHPPELYLDKQLFEASFGYIYSLLGRYGEAEKHYLQMLQLELQVNEENQKTLGFHSLALGNGPWFIIGKFYAEQKQFDKAKNYLQQSLNIPENVEAKQASDTHFLLFKTDSALGNYLSAINHLEKHKALYDSMNSVSRNKQISELTVKYETEMHMSRIRSLQDQEKLQHAEIERSHFIRNTMVGFAVFLLLLAMWAYLGYRNKQRVNHQLQTQQQEINSQNVILQSLLNEKDVFLKEKDLLLEEKDWLLKEVHHRVKNNLQLIMSLLRTQAVYLQTHDAKQAILESGNRVEAISLIHQKLYTSEKPASIDMPSYITDLVSYLADGYNTVERGISFKCQIEAVQVDLSQAVPLGLILNEAITNAIKYAFAKRGGNVSIQLQRTEINSVRLQIADNGIGLPPDFDAGAGNTLGMEMMKGLTRQIRGSFSLYSVDGLIITIEFKPTALFQDESSPHEARVFI